MAATTTPTRTAKGEPQKMTSHTLVDMRVWLHGPMLCNLRRHVAPIWSDFTTSINRGEFPTGGSYALTASPETLGSFREWSRRVALRQWWWDTQGHRGGANRRSDVESWLGATMFGSRAHTLRRLESVCSESIVHTKRETRIRGEPVWIHTDGQPPHTHAKWHRALLRVHCVSVILPICPLSFIHVPRLLYR
jgi:hypothetical protein